MKNSPSITLLRDRDFAALWAAANLADTGYNLRTMAQAWLILELFDSQFWVGMATGIRVGPVVILALFSGVFIDRFGGRVILIVDRLLLLGTALITALVIMTDSVQLWHIVTLGAISGGMTAFGRPATNSLIPAFVPREKLLAANSLTRLSNTIGQGIGPAIGGVLFAAYGLSSPFLALAALYALATMATLRIKSHKATARSDNPPGWGQIPKEIAQGFSFAMKTPTIKWLLFLSVTVIFTTTWYPTVPFYARDVLNVGEIGMGVLFSAFAIGGTVGALLIANIGGKQNKAIFIVVAAILRGGAMILFGYSTVYAVSIVAMFFMGFSASLWATTIITVLQTSSTDEMRGRVMSLWAITMQMTALGWIVGGVLGEAWGNQMMLLVTGGLFIVLPVIVVVISRELRKAG